MVELYFGSTPQVGNLRVWHIPQIPGKPFHVRIDSLEEGGRILDILAHYDIFQYENKIKPDYSNDSGIERYEDDGDGVLDWFEVDPYEYEDF